MYVRTIREIEREMLACCRKSLLLNASTNTRRLYSSSSSSSGGHHGGDMFPSVRRLLKEYGIGYNDVKATGPQGRVVKGDVLNHVTSKNIKPVDLKSIISTTTSSSTQTKPTTTTISTTTTTNTTVVKPPSFEDIPHNNIRRVIATKLTKSKQEVPHLYMTVQCEIDQLLELRTKLNNMQSTKLSVNDFIIKACALALRDVPEANARWDENKKEAVRNGTVDVSVAVATDRGLITPIVTKTDSKSLGQVAIELKDLAGRARIGKLKPEEFQGGTFSVSNLGMFGITHFNAIINHPQAGILAVGAGRKIVKTSSIIHDIDNYAHPSVPSGVVDVPQVANVIDVTLSGDNRVFDDEIAAKFLEKFRSYVSNPQAMLI
ncbi:pyruvate dehydrogenase complex [Cavenderia fasciculata]|uniref:Pyruvate dehydrogenase complex n=1 Tax=Cavenderia fasciculata TaxID=261658 RepID=F4Q0U8_CACFS|nr:pyruvate dehydrogenase complex [Cavenderia fasciculata]EGG18449.1 pyruvate dehydrogenase complex [Cavenderia fasciculata]|eukprot:XP_004366353.1 pyruvate dehydrogenase complex [Cavenderia fasciculata]